MRSILVALLVLGWLAGPARAQSMAEAARKEAARREKNKKAGVKAKAYGDDELAAAGGHPAAGAEKGEPAAPAAEAEASVARTESGGGDDAERRQREEQSWRQRVAEATARRDDAKAFYEWLGTITLAQGDYVVNDKDRVVIKGIDDLRAKIAAAKSRWEAAEKALADLLEEARRAGVPPGWLR
jgi:hypothetical protein